MSLSHMEKRAKQESKVSHFRIWKSGKLWLYSASILASLIAVGIAPTLVTNASFGSIVAHADVTKSGTTILVNSKDMNGAQYIYIWNQNTNSIDGQMSFVGNGYYAYTYSGAAPSAITLALSNIGGQTGSNWPGDCGNMPVADGSGNVNGISPTYNFVTVNGYTVQQEAAPTLTAPTALADGVSGTSYDLSTQAQPVYATTYSTTALTKGSLTYSVTDPKGANVAMSGMATFVPNSAGTYTVTYTQNYTDAAGKSYDMVATQTVIIQNQITTPVTGKNIVSGVSTDLSAATMGVTSSDSSLIPTITSVTLDGQPVSADSGSSTNYTFNTSGTYVITYSDGTGATGTITGNVTPATPVLAQTDVSYTDGSSLSPTTPIDLSAHYVGDVIKVPDAPQIQGRSCVGVTYNGVTVQIGDEITLIDNGSLVYTYASFFTSLTPTGTSTGQVGTEIDAASLEKLVDPSDATVSISNATITVTDGAGNDIPLDGSYHGHYWVLGTTFTPTYADIYTITYSYIDQLGMVQTATQIVNVLPAPSIDSSGLPLSSDGSNTLVVNVDGAGKYHFDPTTSVTGINQGYDTDGNLIANVIYRPVTYTDPAIGVTDSSNFPVGSIIVLDSNGNEVDPANLTIGTYTIEWQYTGANGSAVMILQILPAGKVAPTLSANSDVAFSGQTVDLSSTASDGSAYVSLTDSDGKAIDLADALADGSLTISVTDPFGETIVLTGTSFTTSLNGYYSVNYDYTDLTTGMSVSAQSSIFVQPQVIAPNDSVLQQGKDTFTFGNPTVVDAENGSKTDGTGYVLNPNYFPYDTNISDGNMSDAGNFISQTLTDASGNIISPADFDKLQAGTYTVTYIYSYIDRWNSNNTNSSTYGAEFQISVTQTVYVSNLTVDNGTGTVGNSMNLAALITDKTDASGTPTSQVISYALINGDQTLTVLPENWTPTLSGTYLIQYSYVDAVSALEVTATSTITVGNGTLTAPIDVIQTATSFTPPATLTDQSGNVVTVTATISGNADLSALTPGTYTITYTAPGYGTVTQKLTITTLEIPATSTVDHKANNGDTLTPSAPVSLIGNVGDVVKIPAAPQVTGNNTTGYTLDKITFNGKTVQAGDNVTLEANNALVHHYTKNPVNTDISETQNVDEQGNVLTDITGYELVSSTVKPAVVTTINQYGDTETATITVKVWKIKTTAATTTTAVDHKANNGDTLTPSALVSLVGNVGDVVKIPAASQVTGNNTNGYTLDKITFNGKTVQVGDSVTLAANNALVYHYTKNPVNTDVNKTQNVDEQGKVLTDTTGYELVSSTVKPAVVTTINQYGDTETTTITRNVWRVKANSVVPKKETPEKDLGSNIGNNEGRKLPNTGEDSDSKWLSSELALMALATAVLGGKLLNKRKK